jgi:hypothetical protein
VWYVPHTSGRGREKDMCTFKRVTFHRVMVCWAGGLGWMPQSHVGTSCFFLGGLLSTTSRVTNTSWPLLALQPRHTGDSHTHPYAHAPFARTLPPPPASATHLLVRRWLGSSQRCQRHERKHAATWQLGRTPHQNPPVSQHRAAGVQIVRAGHLWTHRSQPHSLE